MTPNIQFLINCCKTTPSAADIEQIRGHIRQSSKTAISQLTTLAYRHSVLPLYYLAIHTHAVGLLSSEVMETLKQYNMDTVMANMRMAAELIRVLKLLKENGIDALPFKGPVLAQLAYGEITLRQYCDLDILIKPKDLQAGSQLLLEQGYTPRVSLDYLKNQAFLDVNHDIGFTKDITIEFHWRLFEKQLIVQFGQEFIWSEFTAVEIYNQSLKTLKIENLIIYLCIHGSKHAWECLQWVADIDRLLRNNHDLDWQLIIERSIELEAEQLVLLGLNLSANLFDTALPEAIENKITNNSGVKKLQGIVLGYYDSCDLVDNRGTKAYYRKLTAFRLAMQNSWLDKVRYFYKNLIQINSADIESLGSNNYSKLRYLLNRPVRLFRQYSGSTED